MPASPARRRPSVLARTLAGPVAALVVALLVAGCGGGGGGGTTSTKSSGPRDVTAGAKVLYSHDFDQPDALDWPTSRTTVHDFRPDHGAYRVATRVGASLVIPAREDGGDIAALQGRHDVTATTKLTFVTTLETQAMGVACGIGGGSGYRVELDQAGRLRTIAYDHTTEVTLHESKLTAPRKGQSYRLAASCVRDSKGVEVVQVHLGTRLVDTSRDTSKAATAGNSGIALVFLCEQPDAVGLFDNLSASSARSA